MCLQYTVNLHIQILRDNTHKQEDTYLIMLRAKWSADWHYITRETVVFTSYIATTEIIKW